MGRGHVTHEERKRLTNPGRGGPDVALKVQLVSCLAHHVTRWIRAAKVIPAHPNRGQVRTHQQVKQLNHAKAADVYAPWRDHVPRSHLDARSPRKGAVAARSIEPFARNGYTLA
jgi:hypothetical protein